MLDYDQACSREIPSVAAMVYPFRCTRFSFSTYVKTYSIPFSSYQNCIYTLFHSGNHKQKFYWGRKEIMIPGISYLSVVLMCPCAFRSVNLIGWQRRMSVTCSMHAHV